MAVLAKLPRADVASSALLLLLAMRHYGYQHLPVAMWGDAFALTASVAIVALVLVLQPWWPIAAWAIGEELLVAGCSVWWLIDPWYMSGQAEQCSARVGLKLGAIGFAALAVITYRLTLSTFTGTTVAEASKNER